MTLLYLTEPGSLLSKQGGRLVISKDKDSVVKSIGMEKLEGIILFGGCHISSGLATELLEREIPVTWLSSSGRFYGRLESTTGFNIERQVLQFERFKEVDFCLQMAKNWITGKIRNSKVLLRRYNRERDLAEVELTCEKLEVLSQKLTTANTVEQVMGYEGAASKSYFQALSLLVVPEFRFEGRSRRPPRDPFNSLLSFGYTLLMYEIYTAIVGKGLHPYLGLMHRPKRGHPALASDLMEEWRAIVAESLTMGLVNTRQLAVGDFTDDASGDGGVYLTQDSSKLFIEKFEKKLRSQNQYLTYVDYPLTFRESIAFQVGSLATAIEAGDPSAYRPVFLR